LKLSIIQDVKIYYPCHAIGQMYSTHNRFQNPPMCDVQATCI
jgi:hypothetical protein